ncbi:AMP-binding protein [Streptomyces sp. NPDC003016]
MVRRGAAGLDWQGRDGFPVIGRERVTITSVVLAVVQLRLDVLPTVQADSSSLRLVQIGGAPLHRETTERTGPAWGCRLQQVFGMAEGLLTLTRPGDPDETVLTAQGRPLSPDDEIRMVGVDGKDVPAGRQPGGDRPSQGRPAAG